MPKPPFKLLYDNDTTNIVRCIGPTKDAADGRPDPDKGLEAGQRFDDALIEASVDEAARGCVDVQKLSPGHSWVAWWKSGCAPAEEHYRWFEKTYGRLPDAYGRYMLAGGDVVAAFARRCRQRGAAPFVSFRINQVQGMGENARQLNWTQWMNENHERLALNEPGAPAKVGRRLDWMLPEVRRHFLAFAEELCACDIDGFEIDFTRHPTLFRQDQTVQQQREDVVSDFVAQVRGFLDRFSRPGQGRWLCVKVPCHLAEHPLAGIDLQRLVAKAGVDMVNASPSYYTQQQTDLPAMRKTLPDTALYLDMADNVQTGESVGVQAKRRTTPHQFHTAAHLAYARGADGVSLFNFRYYSQWDSYAEAEGAWVTPPFEILERLHDPQWLARQPQHWFLARGYGGYHPSLAGSGKMMQNARCAPQAPFPFVLRQGQTVSFALDMAPPAGGWTADGRCRLQSPASLLGRTLTLALNGARLQPCADVSAFYGNPYPSPLDGRPEDYRAWIVPHSLLKDGENRFLLEMAVGDPAELFYFDLAVR